MSNLNTNHVNIAIGRYQIQDKLGSGGMARVYKALDNNLGRNVAIKVLHEHLTEEPTFKERFVQEARLVASFNHPNIVQVFDFDSIERDGQTFYYMVMPYISGQTLTDRLENLDQTNASFSREHILQIIRDLASALDYAHLRGMVHRDIKPGNIMFDEHDKAILTDFGIARLAQNSKLTQEGATIGTPAYMSPEQATGGIIDSRSDIYALGIILYELLTGQPPFADDGTLSVLIQHVTAPIPTISEFLHMPNEDLDSIIFRALAKLPEDRYQTAGDLLVDLEDAFAGRCVNRSTPTRIMSEPVSSLTQPAPTDVTPIPKASRPHNSPLGILAIGLAVIIVLLVIGIFSQQSRTIAATPQSSNDTNADSMTGDFFFNSSFEDAELFNQFWSLESSDVMQRTIANGHYILTETRKRTATATLFAPDYTYGNVTIKMVAHLQSNSAPASGYGIVFRHTDNNNYNVFAVDGLGRYSIWVRESGEWHELRGTGEQWSTHPVIYTVGKSNQLVLDIYDNMLTGYINDEKVVSVTDDTLSTGTIGIYIASTREGITSISVDSYQAEESIPASDSMTDDSANSMTGEEVTPETTNEN